MHRYIGVFLCAGITAGFAAIPGDAEATYWYDYYAGASCQPLWGNEQDGHRGADGSLYNPDYETIHVTCPMTNIDAGGGASWYDDVVVRVKDGNDGDVLGCQVRGCYGTSCLVSSRKETQVAFTGETTLSWINAFSVSWSGRHTVVTCDLPARDGEHSSFIRSYYGERDWS